MQTPEKPVQASSTVLNSNTQDLLIQQMITLTVSFNCFKSYRCKPPIL